MLIVGCTSAPERALLHGAGLAGAATQCHGVEGMTRTSVCGTVLTLQQVRTATDRLGLSPLPTPARLGQVTNQFALPAECQILLLTGPLHGVSFAGVFGAPASLHERTSGVQYESLVLARSAETGQSCFIFAAT